MALSLAKKKAKRKKRNPQFSRRLKFLFVILCEKKINSNKQ